MSVETIRDIPVIIEHRTGCSADSEPVDFDDVYYYDSGFPFDNTQGRSRDPLEDIAQRHPEFAQHLQGFPRRNRRTSGGQDPDQDEFLRRRFERPFSSGRFERFGFPFDRADFEREPQRYYDAYPEYFENFHNQNPPQTQHNSASSQTPQGYQQYPAQYSQEYQPQPQKSSQPQYNTQASVSQGTQTDDGLQSAQQETQSLPQQTQDTTNGEAQESKQESGQSRGRPIQQSNTCDLAQHQLPDEEALNERGQRSMSAPPENNNKQTRFTSSVNIPMGGHQEAAAGHPQPTAGAKTTASGSTERVIPIHVEGRDDPVIPKHFAGSTASQNQPQPERIFSESPRQQPETIFGRRPEAFTQFVHREPRGFNNDWPHSFRDFPEDDFGFRQTESPTRFAQAPRTQHPQKQHHESQTQKPPQPQTEAPPQQAPKQPQQAPKQPQQPQPQQQKQPLGPIEQIQEIQKDVSSLIAKVEAFSGAPKDKTYLYLDEMLTRNLLKLDNVDTQGQDAIRSARKEAIKCIEKTIGLLEARALANVAAKEEKMEVEQPQTQEKEQTMDTEASNVQEAVESVQPEASQEASKKSGDEPIQEQGSQAVENPEAEAKKEDVKTEERKTAEAAPAVEAEQTSNPEAITEIKHDEKKEKKKIKKKVNKEDKDKKQQ